MDREATHYMGCECQECMPDTSGRETTACGNPVKHGPHDECGGIPLPPIRDEVGPGVAEALRADVIRQLAWTEDTDA